MNNYFILAWRNIWRNKRRTLITAASIFFALFLALIMRSFQVGTYAHMINSVVESYTGFIQIQEEEYWSDRTIDNTFEMSDELYDKIQSSNNVSLVVPRLESFALASSGNKTKGVLVLGVDPEKEKVMSKLENRLVKFKLTEEAIENIEQEKLPSEILKKIKELKNSSYSTQGKMEIDLELTNGEVEEYMPIICKHSVFNNNNYLKSQDTGVLVADRLSKFLKLSVGDTIVLIGQGYHGMSAANKFPIRGIVKIPNPELDNMLVYLELSNSQEFYSAYNMLTSLSINLDNSEYKNVKKTKALLESKLDDDVYAVKDWKELNPELVQQIESDNGSGLIMITILYIIVAFGIFGTVLMMTAERRKEFGVMVAVGMRKTKLAFVVVIEMIMLGFIALIAGILGSIPIIQWYYHNPIRLTGDMAKSIENFGMEPIMPFAWQADIFINQTLVVNLLIILAIFYPIFAITRIKVIKALRD